MSVKGKIKSATERLPLPVRRHLAYAARHRRPAYVPGVVPPRTFTGKVQWRILNDRREVLRMTCDKLWMKDYGAGRGVASPETWWSGTDLDELAAASADFPGRWVLKPNHLSGHLFFHDGPAEAETLRGQAGWWPQVVHAESDGEWATQHARRVVVAEEALTLEGVDLPDYKFFVFDGRPEVVQVVSGRFGQDGKGFAYYRPEGWGRLDVRERDVPVGGDVPAPPELPLLVETAARLGQGWDFMRIDLFARDGQVWLGETTPYPKGGRALFEPRSFDRWLGGRWTLPRL